MRLAVPSPPAGRGCLRRCRRGGKKTDDVGHHAGVVVDVDFEDGPGQGATFFTGMGVHFRAFGRVRGGG